MKCWKRQQNLSPSISCIECTGIYLWRSLAPVRNHCLLHACCTTLKWDTHRTSTLVSGGWITIKDGDESLTAYIYPSEFLVYIAFLSLIYCLNVRHLRKKKKCFRISQDLTVTLDLWTRLNLFCLNLIENFLSTGIALSSVIDTKTFQRK